jgi:hypothetical protein
MYAVYIDGKPALIGGNTYCQSGKSAASDNFFPDVMYDNDNSILQPPQLSRAAEEGIA